MSGAAKAIVGGIGSLAGGLLGGPKVPKVPAPPPPAPRISGADASGRAARGRLRRRRGLSSTVLTQGLGRGTGVSGVTGTAGNILGGAT